MGFSTQECGMWGKPALDPQPTACPFANHPWICAAPQRLLMHVCRQSSASIQALSIYPQTAASWAWKSVHQQQLILGGGTQALEAGSGPLSRELWARRTQSTVWGMRALHEHVPLSCGLLTPWGRGGADGGPEGPLTCNAQFRSPSFPHLIMALSMLMWSLLSRMLYLLRRPLLILKKNFLNIYLFLWLHRLLVAAHGIPSYS